MRLLVCGSRYWNHREFLYEVLDHLDLDEIEAVIEGEAPGADTMAREWAESRGIGDRVLRFPANWDLYGRAAGPIRNKQMIVEGKPTLVVAFSENLDNSRGTKNMVQQSLKADLDVFTPWSAPYTWVDFAIQNAKESNDASH